MAISFFMLVSNNHQYPFSDCLRGAYLKSFLSTPFFCGSGGGSPRCRQITASSSSSGMSLPSTTISSPTITAGATGRSSSKYSSVTYSALGLDMVSISTWYLWPSLGIISLKCFHGLPLGSFIKNLTFNMFFSFLARMFHESLAATADMAVLPGVLGCRTLRRTVRYASDPIPRYRGTSCPVARPSSRSRDTNSRNIRARSQYSLKLPYVL
jgi:hypothetical protein